jgi:hypothetical protein
MHCLRCTRTLSHLVAPRNIISENWGWYSAIQHGWDLNSFAGDRHLHQDLHGLHQREAKRRWACDNIPTSSNVLGSSFAFYSSAATSKHNESSLKPSDQKIVQNLLVHIWPSDNPEFRWRVVGALGLLIGSKFLNIQVRQSFSQQV